MSNNNLKELYREYIEVVWNQKGNLAAMAHYFDPDFVDHTAPPGTSQGLEGTLELFAMLQAAFPDYHTTIELQVAEGDWVATRLRESGTHRGILFGIPPTGVTSA